MVASKIATATFLLKENGESDLTKLNLMLFLNLDLYSQLAFVAKCSEGSDLHELPHPVQNKMHVEDLQLIIVTSIYLMLLAIIIHNKVDDIFLWKHSKICSINASALEAPHVTSYEERSTRSSRGSKPKRFQGIKCYHYYVLDNF